VEQQQSVVNDEQQVEVKTQGGDRLFVSPMAKRLASEKSIDLSLLKGKGSGPNGRIISKDVLNYQPTQ
jgi:pyruvate dehydrogenase E2 component (dihydrolipoamide acetyltransferase)